MSPYRVLGLSDGASAADVKAAYRKLVKEFHPDVNPEGASRIREINSAYQSITKGKPFEAASQPQQRKEVQEYSATMTLNEVAWGTYVTAPGFITRLPCGARTGDLFWVNEWTSIRVTVTEQQGRYRRQDDDIYVDCFEVRERQLKKGDIITFENYPGIVPFLALKPEWKDGTLVRVSGRGMPKLAERGGGFGDFYVRLKVIPTQPLRQRFQWWHLYMVLITLCVMVLITLCVTNFTSVFT